MAIEYVKLKPDPESVEEIKALIQGLNDALKTANELYDQLAERQDLKISISFLAKQDCDVSVFRNNV